MCVYLNTLVDLLECHQPMVCLNILILVLKVLMVTASFVKQAFTNKTKEIVRQWQIAIKKITSVFSVYAFFSILVSIG